MSNIAFVVTTHCSLPSHCYYLEQCVKAIRKIYPTYHIYVLDDCSTLELPILHEQNLSIHKTLYQRCGEINPYFFILTDECKHDRLIYIHDTVILKKEFPEFPDDEVVVLWNADRLESWNLEFDKTCKQIYNSLLIKGYPAIFIANSYVLEQNPYYVTFGAMSIFTKSFVRKSLEISNLEEIAPLFNSRVRRCLFERVFSIFIFKLYGYENIKVLFGEIFDHPNAFENTDINISEDLVAVKVWQGR